MTNAQLAPPLCCRGACAAAAAHPAHHDRLLRVDRSVEAMLELLEIAVTWHELDWSGVVGPQQWLGFAAAHEWVDPQRAERVFSLAADIVGRGVAHPASTVPLAPAVELVGN